jgi:hypothetical protein
MECVIILLSLQWFVGTLGGACTLGTCCVLGVAAGVVVSSNLWGCACKWACAASTICCVFEEGGATEAAAVAT